MNKAATILFFIVLPFAKLSAQCPKYKTITCDGISTHFGSGKHSIANHSKNDDGVGKENTCVNVNVNLSNNPYYDASASSCNLVLTSTNLDRYSVYLDQNKCEILNNLDPDYVLSNGDKIESIQHSPHLTFLLCSENETAVPDDINFSISCSTIENCLNKIDDDQNGFIDCDDPGCNLKCEYTATTSSYDGGLESNNRLSEKIAARNYERNIHSSSSSTFDSTLLLGRFSEDLSRNELNLSKLTPWDCIKNSESVETTPFDLIHLTNASDIFAYDTYKNGKRIASLFATETYGKVYEHSKNVCDRLAGSEIQSIWNHDFDTKYTFIVSKLLKPDGLVEYNCNFSIIKSQDGHWQLESHWNISDYSEGLQIFNFQLWANNTYHLERMLERSLSNLAIHLQLEASSTSDAPKTFIQSISYHNKIVTGKIYNPELKKSIDISGHERYVERSRDRRFQKKIQLSGRLIETFEFKTNGIFDMSFSLGDPSQEISDFVYIADGAWGVENPRASAILHRYEFLAESAELNKENSCLIERGISLKGRIKNELVIYRALKPHQGAVDLSAFDTFNFTASGHGNLEIVLVNQDRRKGQVEIRTEVELKRQAKVHSIKKGDFINIQEFDWKTISMILFKIEGGKNAYQDFELNLSNLHFKSRNESKLIKTSYEDFEISPNPMDQTALISVNFPLTQAYELEIWSMSGHLVSTTQGKAYKGLNQIQIYRNGLASGAYTIRIIAKNRKLYLGKLVLI